MTHLTLKPVVIHLEPRLIGLFDKAAQDMRMTRADLIARSLERDYRFISQFEAPRPNK